MTAEIEKVVADADRLPLQQVLPDLDEVQLHVVARGDERGLARPAFAVAGAGRASRSTLPLGVSGSAGRSTNADGSMYSGSFDLSRARSSAARRRGPRAVRRRRRRRAPARPASPRAARRALRESAASLRSTVSISPGSMRCPRSFTCWSSRPRNSRLPSGRYRTRSPVRYIRAPGCAASISATNRSSS